MEECMDVNTTCDLDVATARLLRLNQNKWWLEASEKPKLETFLQIHDRSLTQPVIRKNLSRSQRSVVMKFKCGVSTLWIETGRYKDIPCELKICRICTSGEVESEQHFLMKCEALSEVRNHHKAKLPPECIDSDTSVIERMKIMLHPDTVKLTSVMLQDMFEKRKELMYFVDDDDKLIQFTSA